MKLFVDELPMSEKTRTCEKCGKELPDMGIQMEDMTDIDSDGMCAECFVGLCKYIIAEGGRIPMFGEMSIEEQTKIVEGAEFLEVMQKLARFCPGQEIYDPHFEKKDPTH